MATMHCGPTHEFVDSHTHWIAMSGSRGCIPDYVSAHKNFMGAVDDLTQMFKLGNLRRAELKHTRFLNLKRHVHGAEYCEIVACDCKDISVHQDL